MYTYDKLCVQRGTDATNIGKYISSVQANTNLRWYLSKCRYFVEFYAFSNTTPWTVTTEKGLLCSIGPMRTIFMNEIVPNWDVVVEQNEFRWKDDTSRPASETEENKTRDWEL